MQSYIAKLVFWLRDKSKSWQNRQNYEPLIKNIDVKWKTFIFLGFYVELLQRGLWPVKVKTHTKYDFSSSFCHHNNKHISTQTDHSLISLNHSSK